LIPIIYTDKIGLKNILLEDPEGESVLAEVIGNCGNQTERYIEDYRNSIG